MGRGKRPCSLGENQTPIERSATITCAKRLNRVFAIDMEICSERGGVVRIIPKTLDLLAEQALANTEDPRIIKKNLTRPGRKESEPFSAHLSQY